jgi:PAX-interacting protein 1
VVIRGIHPSSDTALMMDKLKTLGFEPVQMLPVYHPVNKIPLPLFFLDLKPQPNNAEIYNLKRLYHAVIRVEPPKPRRVVIQCMDCQEYGHTRNYCHKKAKCVKCGDAHLSGGCTKPVTTPPICANCKGDHTANYKGCPVHTASHLPLYYKKWRRI